MKFFKCKPIISKLVFSLILLCLQCKEYIPSKSSNPRFKNYSISIYRDSEERPIASGILLDKTGYAITVFHAVTGYEDRISVSFTDLKKENAKVVAKEFLFDLALIKIPALENQQGLEISEIEDRENLQIGENIYQFSSAYGLNNSFFTGYISHLNRVETDITYPKIPFIQTNGLSYPGSSGSGVFSFSGKFIGIQRANFGYVAGGNIGLVIPGSFVKLFIKNNVQK